MFSKSKKGFTLIELLVVISIIALLVSILMPALSKARQRGQMAVCLGNQRALVQAYIMFTHENNDSLPDADVYLNNTNSWVLTPRKLDGTLATIHNVTLEDRHRGIQAGSLYKYLDVVGVYNCPGDSRLQKGCIIGDPKQYMFRSYCIQGGLNGEERTRAGSTPTPTKMSNVRRPSSTYVFVEHEYDGAYNNICNPRSWVLGLDNNPYGFQDRLSLWHGDSSTMSFADGSAINRRWEDLKIREFCKDRDAAITKYGAELKNTTDYQFMQRGYGRRLPRS